MERAKLKMRTGLVCECGSQKGDRAMCANYSESDQRIIRRLETALAEWDRSGEETYLELAERLLRLIRMQDNDGILK